MRTLLVAAFFVGGVALGGATSLAPSALGEWVGWGTIVAAAVLGIISTRLGRVSVLAPVLLLVAMLGVVRGGQGDDTRLWQAVPYNAESVQVEVELLGTVGLAESGDYRLTAQAYSLNGGDAKFPLYVYTGRLASDGSRNQTSFYYGDRYLVTGRFRRAPADRAVAGYIGTSSVTLLGHDAGNPFLRQLAAWRGTLVSGLLDVMPSEVAGLAGGVAYGDRSHITPAVYASFRQAGLAHLLALSGLHVAVVGGVILVGSAALFGRRRQLYLLAPFIAVWLYALTAGLPPSAVRATIMFSVFLLARLLGRQAMSLPALGLAAAVMVAVEPPIVRQVAFQLSFGAVAGIATITPILSDLWSRYIDMRRPGFLWKPIGAIANLLAVALGATVFTAPLILVTFGALPVVGWLATIVALPALPFFIGATFATNLGLLIFEPLGQVIGWLAWLFGAYIRGVAELFASERLPILGNESTDTLFVPGWIFPIWLTVCLVAMLRREIWYTCSGAYRLVIGGSWLVPWWAAGLLWAVAVVFILGAATANSGRMEIHFPQTTVGDMIVIQSPGRSQVLVDGGRETLEAVDALDDILPFWDRTVDMVVPTHYDADHIGGLQAVVERYKVAYILDSRSEHDTTVSRSWRAAIASHPGLMQAWPRAIFELKGGGSLEVLWAGFPDGSGDSNDFSTVMRLTYGEFSVLLTGDIDSEIEHILVSSGINLEADVLKVSHHGSKNSSSSEFLAAVNPRIAVIQSGSVCKPEDTDCFENPYGHPHQEAVARLVEAVGGRDRLFVTAQDGDIKVISDGLEFKVTTTN